MKYNMFLGTVWVIYHLVDDLIAIESKVENCEINDTNWTSTNLKKYLLGTFCSYRDS